MSNPTIYLEVDSTYRDRNSFPEISEFELQVSQSTKRTKEKSLDPVCLSAPVAQWTGNRFNAATSGTSIALTVVTVPTIPNMNIPYATDNTNIIVRATLPGTLLQKIKNYYITASVRVQLSAGPPITYAYRNITYYEWLSTDGTYDYARIILSSPFQDTVLPLGTGVSIEIFEPIATFSPTINPPCFFVPNGYIGANCYYGLYMYNETQSEYRKIINYDAAVNLAFLESPVDWLQSENFSIRKELPLYSALEITIPSSIPDVPPTSTIQPYESSNLSTITCAQGSLSSETDFYKDSYIRIIPKGVNNVYGRNQLAPTGEMRRIIGYSIGTAYTISWIDSITGLTVVPIQYIAYLSTIFDYVYMFVVNQFMGIAGPLLIMTNFALTQIKVTPLPIPIGSVAINLWNPTFWPGPYINLSALIFPTPMPAFSWLSYQSATFSFSPPFSAFPSDSTHQFEILNWSYDNSTDLTYSGALISQPEMVCVELLNIILPNKTLNSQYGSRIAYYPYVYVELSNVSSGGSGLTNIIYSNNPNSTKMVFRACVDDMNQPLNSAFVKIDGDRMVQMMKFQANSAIRFRVLLPNGELFKVNDPEYFSPNEPNAKNQITALFAIKRL